MAPPILDALTCRADLRARGDSHPNRRPRTRESFSGACPGLPARPSAYLAPRRGPAAPLAGFRHGCMGRSSGWPARSGLCMRLNPFNLDEKPDLHAGFRGRVKAGRHPSVKHQVDSPLHSERHDPLPQSACKRRFSSKSAASTPRRPDIPGADFRDIWPSRPFLAEGMFSRFNTPCVPR